MMMTEYLEISGIFLHLIRRVLTILTEHFEIGRIFQRVFVLMRRSFPTIFRQLSDNKSKSKPALPGLDPTSSRITTCYSTTAPHSLYIFDCVNCFYVRHCCVFLRQYSVHLRQYCVFFVSTVLNFVSTQYCVFLCQYSVHLCQDCVFLCQNCINFRQFCVFLRQNSVHLRQNCVFIRQYCVKLSEYCFFFVSTVLTMVSTVFSSIKHRSTF
jgi:hypothetical protein